MQGSHHVIEDGVGFVDLAALRAAGGDLSSVVALGDEPGCRVVLLKAADGALDAWPVAGQAAIVASSGLPTLVWVDGSCTEEGFEIALACDLRIAGSGASFRLGQTQAGGLPSDGGSQRLLRTAGRAAALWMLLTGTALDADEALGRGIVQRIGTFDDATAICRAIAAAAPIATAYTREAVNEGADLSLVQGLRLEADLSFLLQSTEDRAEGLRSFRERRPPKYEGR